MLTLPESSLMPVPQKIQKIRAPAWRVFEVDRDSDESWQSTDSGNEDEKYQQVPTTDANKNSETDIETDDDTYGEDERTPTESSDETTIDQDSSDRPHKQLLIHGGYRRHPQFPSLHLLGERHTGTNWMTRHLEDCFAGIVDIVLGYSDWKHWFQFEEGSLSNASVVVAQFRSTYKGMIATTVHGTRNKAPWKPQTVLITHSTFILVSARCVSLDGGHAIQSVSLSQPFQSRVEGLPYEAMGHGPLRRRPGLCWSE